MTTNQTHRILKNFGLSENEIRVYLESLKHEELTPYKISKATGIPRTTVYDVLMNLSLKGLVELEQSDGFTKQQTLVRAKNPSALRKILQKNRHDLLKLETDIINILPRLKADYHKSKPNTDFQFYPGVEGFKEVYLTEKMIDVDTQIYTWDCLMPMDVIGSEEMNRLVSEIDQKRRSYKHKSKELIAWSDWSRHVLSYQFTRDNKYLDVREVRYLDNPAFDLSVEINLIGTQVRISCAKEDEVWGMVINSKALSNSLKAIFQVQWMTATPVTVKMVKSWGPNEMLKFQKKRKLS